MLMEEKIFGKKLLLVCRREDLRNGVLAITRGATVEAPDLQT